MLSSPRVLVLGFTLATVLFCPLLIKKAEQNIEVFFLAAGTFTPATTG